MQIRSDNPPSAWDFEVASLPHNRDWIPCNMQRYAFQETSCRVLKLVVLSLSFGYSGNLHDSTRECITWKISCFQCCGHHYRSKKNIRFSFHIFRSWSLNKKKKKIRMKNISKTIKNIEIVIEILHVNVNIFISFLPLSMENVFLYCISKYAFKMH